MLLVSSLPKLVHTAGGAQSCSQYTVELVSLAAALAGESHFSGAGTSLTDVVICNCLHINSAGTLADLALENSAAHWKLDASTPALGGFNSPLACVTKPGYGLVGRYAHRCEVGWYNAGGNYAPCTQCPFGLSTTNDAAGQISIDNCTVAPGFGVYNSSIQSCPIGECLSNCAAPWLQ